LTFRGPGVNTSAVRFARHLLAVLTLLGWLGAFGHVALDHGGVADGGALAELLHGVKPHEHHAGAHHAEHEDGNRQHHDRGLPEGEEHHHDFAALDGGKWMKSAEIKTMLPQSAPLDVAVAGRWLSTLRESGAIGWFSLREHAPPLDQRLSGWLLVVQTARPVRGPSLVA
jgi:hypothetical protein